MSDLYFVMRGLSRVCAVLAALWLVGRGVDALFGDPIATWSNPQPGGAFGTELLRVLIGGASLLGIVIGVSWLHAIGGGDSQDESEP